MAKLERTDKPVNVLLEELSRGELGLPEIQRGYVWNRPQARDLIDSLYREYPSGLILLWKPDELPELRNESFEHSDERQIRYLVLDGQQRLTSLKQVFEGKIPVYFNVEEETFQLYSTKLKANPLWVSVRDVITRGAIEILDEIERSSDLDKEKRKVYGQRLTRLERIKEYRFPVMIIHTDDYEEVTESFIRINSRGTRLREAELVMAQLAYHWPGALVKAFETALDDYEQKNYEIEARFLMRCFVAVGTGQSRFKHLGSLWKKSQSELEDIWKRTKKALDCTINFLSNNAGIDSSDWIPSINALVPLVVFFSRRKEQLSEKEARGLLFWFFEATIHGRFTGSPETKLDQDIRAIVSDAPLDNLMANLKREIARLEITPEMIEGKYQRHPFLPLMFVIFRHKKATDWFTGIALSAKNVGTEHQLEFHHIFPRAVLKEAGDLEAHEIDDLANIAFLSKKANISILKSPPNEYLPRIETERLRAQLVPLDEGLWHTEKYREFLVRRRSLLTDAINEYLSELGGVKPE